MHSDISPNIPTVYQFAWVSLIPQFAVIGIFSIIAHYLGLNTYLTFSGELEFVANIMWGAIGFTILSITIRAFLVKFHRKGFSLLKRGEYLSAIPFFMRSYKLFSKYKWLDKYRYFLISSSKMAYREMDLNNIAFCYGQVGDKEMAIKYYELLLDEFPTNGLAAVALKFAATIEDKN